MTCCTYLTLQIVINVFESKQRPISSIGRNFSSSYCYLGVSILFRPPPPLDTCLLQCPLMMRQITVCCTVIPKEYLKYSSITGNVHFMCKVREMICLTHSPSTRASVMMAGRTRRATQHAHRTLMSVKHPARPVPPTHPYSVSIHRAALSVDRAPQVSQNI